MVAGRRYAARRVPSWREHSGGLGVGGAFGFGAGEGRDLGGWVRSCARVVGLRRWVGTHPNLLLTTEANEIVRPIHAKAMPVILTGEDCDAWLEGDMQTAPALQRPFSAERLVIVAKGQKQDTG
jgi:hypothetical protein